MAVLAQALDDHLQDCTSARTQTNDRLKRIEGILIAVAASIILQLMGAVGFLAAKAFAPAPPPAATALRGPA